eukprot:1166108-Prymnesium_polylepis.1
MPCRPPLWTASSSSFLGGAVTFKSLRYNESDAMRDTRIVDPPRARPVTAARDGALPVSRCDVSNFTYVLLLCVGVKLTVKFPNQGWYIDFHFCPHVLTQWEIDTSFRFVYYVLYTIQRYDVIQCIGCITTPLFAPGNGTSIHVYWANTDCYVHGDGCRLAKQASRAREGKEHRAELQRRLRTDDTTTLTGFDQIFRCPTEA